MFRENSVLLVVCSPPPPPPPPSNFILSYTGLLPPLATVVELAETSYTISESDEVVEVCINAVGANSSCPSTEPFHVSLSTTDQTAGVY